MNSIKQEEKVEMDRKSLKTGTVVHAAGACFSSSANQSKDEIEAQHRQVVSAYRDSFKRIGNAFHNNFREQYPRQEGETNETKGGSPIRSFGLLPLSNAIFQGHVIVGNQQNE